MRFVTVSLFVAAGLGLMQCASGQTQTQAPPLLDGSPLPLQASTRIEPRPASNASPRAADQAALPLQPDAQLSGTPLFSTVWSEAMKEGASQAPPPWFDRVRPMVEMQRQH